MKAAGGRNYQRFRDEYFELVDSNYSASKGVAKAYRIREEKREEIMAMIANVEKSKIEPCGKYEFYRTETFNYFHVKTLADSGDLGCQLLLKKGHNRNGLLIVYQKYRQHNGVGRAFAVGFGAQQMPKRTRHFIMLGLNYINLDMKNAIPTILVQMLEGHFEYLNQIAHNREKSYEIICRGLGVTWEVAKVLTNAIIHGARIGGDSWRGMVSYKGRGPLSGTGETGQHSEEFRAAMTLLEGLSNDANRAAQDVAQRAGLDQDAPERFRLLAIAAQDIENSILMSAVGYFEDIGVEVSTLVFDGLYARGLAGVDHCEEETLQGLYARVMEDTGYSVEFSQLAVDGKISDGNCLTLAA